MHRRSTSSLLALLTVAVLLAAPAPAAETGAHRAHQPGDDPPAEKRAEYDIVQYGKDCAKLIADAPPFNCLDGEIIPITVDGKTPATYTRHMKCDKPAYLPYPEKSDGQCTPYSRVLTVRDDDVQMLLFCRRMYIRDEDSPFFDSMEIIMHNVVTGSTCFFISDNFGGKPEGDDGRRVPPPSEETPPAGNVSAREMWASPAEIADHGCINCHDSDPWMRTPWIAQTEQLPTNPFGYHSVDVGGPFAAWPKPMSITTRGNTCTGCHRIGSLNTCGARVVGSFGLQPAKMMQSVGRAPHGKIANAAGGSITDGPDVTTASAGTYPHSYWMPVGNQLTKEEWDVTYERDLAELERCCADHTAPGCIVEPILGRDAWLKRAMSAHAEVAGGTSGQGTALPSK